ncbi:hypothetical protein [Nonomuraea fuscirosea]|nr:hypothetical protein [Nonomuraea fuscirosea]
MDYTREQAARRVHGGMTSPPTDFTVWLRDMRSALDYDDLDG